MFYVLSQQCPLSTTISQLAFVLNCQPCASFLIMFPIWSQKYIIASTRRKISRRLPGLESLREKKGVFSSEDLLTINGTKDSISHEGARAEDLSKSEYFIGEVLAVAASVMNVTKEEHQSEFCKNK
ncbi:hypothetical protein TNCV_4994331 [Trichonephila clavipes]|nr:hypothetical protein TNCV_4994331 [Trichonephila clavipes]